MNCLAIVADVTQTIEAFRTSNLLLIECCPIDCSKKMRDNTGLNNCVYLRLTNHGFKKGESPVNEENINTLCEIAGTYC